MNRYTRRFEAACPNNDQKIAYTLMIETDEVIMVEDIVAFTEAIGKGFHEAIADDMHVQFGGRQVLTAFHHGVDILTVRGSE
jgi:hypothetical protein